MQSGRPSIDLPELESVRRLRESGRMMEGGPGSGPRKGQSRNRGETKPKFSKGTKRVPEPTLSQQIKSGNTNVKAMKSLVQAAGFKRDPDNDGDYDKAFSHKNGTSMHLEHGGWTHVVNEDGDIGGEGSDAKSLKDYIRKGFRGHEREQD